MYPKKRVTSLSKLFTLAIVVIAASYYFNSENLNNIHQKLLSLQKDSISKNAAVLGVATGYDLSVFKRFVGSLRATGYSGHIILGVDSNMDGNIVAYLKGQNVQMKPLEVSREKCTYYGSKLYNGNSYGMPCFTNYPDYQVTWGRFALYKDWLMECSTCTGGVMLTDVRDVFFQRDPFADEQKLHSLMLFEENLIVSTDNWLTQEPLKLCKNYKFHGEPMICSGSTMGSLDGIIDYIKVMVREFDDWKTKDECRTHYVGDDQAIHDYLYYTDQFKDPFVVKHRTGPIHVVGVQADLIHKRAIKEAEKENVSVKDYYATSSGKWQNWLPEDDNLIDPKTGLILNEDGSPSPQVHQIDRFGDLISAWLEKMEELNWPYN